MSMAVVDCEHHVIVESLDDLTPYLTSSWAKRLRMGEFAMPRPGPHPGTEIEARPGQGGAEPAAAAAALAPEVTQALLIPSQPLVSSGWLGHAMATVFSAAVNDHVVATWLPADPRLRFAISVPAHDGEAAAAEIRRLGSHPAAAAVCFSPIAVNLGQRHYHSIYAAAAEHDLAVIVHAGGFEGNVVGPAVLGGVGPRTPEDTFCLLPQVAMSGISSLIFDGVFERFRELKVVFAGFGLGWAPPLLWRMDSEWRGLRIEVPWLTRAPSEVAAQHIRFVVDGAVERGPAGTGLWGLAGMLDPGALVWGSDVPFARLGAEQALAGAPADVRARIAGANALDSFARLGAAAPAAV
jgi:predicted TIM-barrel fold metal-dependent hydrolase